MFYKNSVKMMAVLLLAILLAFQPVHVFAEEESKVIEYDSVYFGTYEQDGNESNGVEPIEWLVLNTNGSKTLLISKYVLDGYCFKDVNSFSSIAWNDSDVRVWLNDYFINKAFSESEIAAITPKVEKTNDFAAYFQNQGAMPSMQEAVFLLSYDEVTYYFPEWIDRAAMPTITLYNNNKGSDGGGSTVFKSIGVSGEWHESGAYYVGWWTRDSSAIPNANQISSANRASVQGIRPSIIVDTSIVPLSEDIPIITPTPTVVPEATLEPTPEPTATPAPTATPKATVEPTPTPEPTSEPTSEPDIPAYPTLEKGAKGDEVKALQERLNALGYNVGTADGDFGNKTYNAICDFQRDNDLETTGIADAGLHALIFSDTAKTKAEIEALRNSPEGFQLDIAAAKAIGDKLAASGASGADKCSSVEYGSGYSFYVQDYDLKNGELQIDCDLDKAKGVDNIDATIRIKYIIPLSSNLWGSEPNMVVISTDKDSYTLPKSMWSWGGGSYVSISISKDESMFKEIAGASEFNIVLSNANPSTLTYGTFTKNSLGFKGIKTAWEIWEAAGCNKLMEMK